MACGGDDTYSSDVTAPGGYYEGRLTPDGSETGVPVEGIVAENGQMLLLDDSERLYLGRLQARGAAFSGDYRTFNMLGQRGPAITTGQFSGTAEERIGLEGRFTEAGGSRGSFSFDYLAAGYETPSSLALVSGSWSQGGVFTISETGVLSGTNDYGCSYTGRLSIINAAYSPYGLQLTETCGTTVRSMSGLALYRRDSLSPGLLEFGEGLVLAAADAEEAVLMGLRR
ncbi:hypothetical protein [Solimonas fluminis]|uniref:hypothetical protein n=1 Tax=Solimonas fluminis TaxID=2086571 RepID=UPI00105701CF|nr:hypothetical protein [Solimonas fluminis]